MSVWQMKGEHLFLAQFVLTGFATAEDLAPFADHVLDTVADFPALLGALPQTPPKA